MRIMFRMQRSICALWRLIVGAPIKEKNGIVKLTFPINGQTFSQVIYKDVKIVTGRNGLMLSKNIQLLKCSSNICQSEVDCIHLLIIIYSKQKLTTLSPSF